MRLSRIPLKLLFATVIVSRLVGEWFPFSRFEMFSRPDGDTTYFFLADANAQPIAVIPQFGLTSKFLGKSFRKRRDRIRNDLGRSRIDLAGAEAAAGTELLDWVARNRHAKKTGALDYAGLQLWRVVVLAADGHVVRHPELVAESSR